MVVVWRKRALGELQKAYEYIALDSLQNAQTVKSVLIQLIGDLPNNPEQHPRDKLKTDNDGSWRAFEKFRYRVSYRILESQIQIVRIRHTKMSPLKF